jgi:hypothetical protein
MDPSTSSMTTNGFAEAVALEVEAARRMPATSAEEVFERIEPAAMHDRGQLANRVIRRRPCASRVR